MSSPRDKQMAEAEELLADVGARLGFAKGLFFGLHLGDKLPAYPAAGDDPAAVALAGRLREFCAAEVDPVAIDRDARIPDAVVRGLGQLGVLGACLPTACGGLGMSQASYCRLLEVLGGHCASTALFVNAHHSIGPRALVLFGTAEQQQRWLPKLASGEWISAFALTEPEAGSDAANVQTRAVPTPDGRGYLVSGEKRWITNGAIAQVLTVMARTPVPGSRETKITAFLVTPDMPGFRVVEPRMPKCGVRGTATARLAFENMFVPRENVLGPLGKGLKVALTVLDFGRTTFGASCTGAARFCLDRAARHVTTRVQFGETLSSFGMVREKLAQMAAGTLAMESATYLTASLIDSGQDDYMVETAMLKVFATETLWRIINDTIQLFGGKAYFTDEPYERLLRDARINQIGEGANDVLRAFSALVGMREVGLELKGVLDSLRSPLVNLTRLGRFTARRLGSLLASPEISVRSAALQDDARAVGQLIGRLGAQVEALLGEYQESIVDQQLHLGRIADAATELYVASAVLHRLDAELHDERTNASATARHLQVGRCYLALAARRVRAALAAVKDHDDAVVEATARTVLEGYGK